MRNKNYKEETKFTRVWGKFLGEFKWNVFLTLHYYNNCNVNSNRNLMYSIFKSNKSNIEKMFYISEYNFDFKGVHSHSLIQVKNVNLLENKLKRIKGICNIDFVSELDLIRDEKEELNVGYYVSKFIDRDLDFDLFL